MLTLRNQRPAHPPGEKDIGAFFRGKSGTTTFLGSTDVISSGPGLME